MSSEELLRPFQTFQVRKILPKISENLKLGSRKHRTSILGSKKRKSSQNRGTDWSRKVFGKNWKLKTRNLHFFRKRAKNLERLERLLDARPEILLYMHALSRSARRPLELLIAGSALSTKQTPTQILTTNAQPSGRPQQSIAMDQPGSAPPCGPGQGGGDLCTWVGHSGTDISVIVRNIF